MFYYRPCIWILAILMIIFWVVIPMLKESVTDDILHMYKIQEASLIIKYFAIIAYVLQTFTSILVVASPIAYIMCFSIISLVGTNLFSKYSLIIRDCAHVCGLL